MTGRWIIFVVMGLWSFFFQCARVCAVESDATVLTLHDAVKLTLTHSVDISIAKQDHLIALAQHKMKLFSYWPIWKSIYSQNKSTYPSVFQTDVSGTNYYITDSLLEFSTEMGSTLPTDTRIFTRFSTERSDTTSSNVLLSPYYFSRLEFGLDQPLLKGFDWFGTHLGNSWAELSISSKVKNRSVWDFKQTVAQIISNVETEYRNVVEIQKRLDAQWLAVDTTKKQLEIVKQKIEAGLLVSAEAYLVEERMEFQQGDYLDLQNELRSAKLKFRDLLGLSSEYQIDEIKFQLEVNERAEAYPVTREDLEDTILKNNLLIQISKIKTDEKRINMLQKKNLLFPTLNFSGGFFLNGGSSPGSTGYGDNLADLMDTRSQGWKISLLLEVPLGPNVDKQKYYEAVTDYYKANEEYRRTRMNLLSEAQSLLEEISLGQALMATKRRTVVLAEKKLEFEHKRFVAGLTTSFNLLEYQQDLTDARVKEIQSFIKFKNAISKLDVLTGRTLANFNVRVDSDKEPLATEIKE